MLSCSHLMEPVTCTLDEPSQNAVSRRNRDPAEQGADGIGVVDVRIGSCPMPFAAGCTSAIESTVEEQKVVRLLQKLPRVFRNRPLPRVWLQVELGRRSPAICPTVGSEQAGAHAGESDRPELGRRPRRPAQAVNASRLRPASRVPTSWTGSDSGQLDV